MLLYKKLLLMTFGMTLVFLNICSCSLPEFSGFACRATIDKRTHAAANACRWAPRNKTSWISTARSRSQLLLLLLSSSSSSSSSSKAPRPVVEPIQPPIQWVMEPPYLDVKRPERESGLDSHLVLRLGARGVMPLIPHNAFIACTGTNVHLFSC